MLGGAAQEGLRAIILFAEREGWVIPLLENRPCIFQPHIGFASLQACKV